MIQIKAWFGDWNTVSIEQARRFAKTMMQGAQAIKQSEKIAWLESEHLRGITVAELFPA